MSSKLSYKVSYYVLYAMFALILIVLGLFFFGGDAQGAAVMAGVDPEMWQPANTDALLYLMYGLFAVAVIATIVAAIFQFGSALKDNPVSAIKSLIGLILLVLVMVVSWAMGSEETLRMPGYDGTENVPFWLKLTDMFLYSIYFLLGATVVAIILSSIWKKLS
ncbi:MULTISPECIES: hypothetical protein [Bacteroides]|uniref:hypothetical protein n=1 Tax=Bacteroides TaxID=816 RepID=UPI000326E56D|nr:MULTISPECIES: hypothetical protein [Bacteroides]EOA48152.1 hypothetical protein HMPREF1532_03814 [Bacteroides salyersiae WAL 10018 = DSM 18765 = JCM 12988]MCS3061403.1 hypothetical protein [Bacteroides salyersiae]UBD16319.1 hypothetical protein K6V19_20060 [Bacteroides salyersiae]UBD65240.1 hypothetical protein K6V25_20650 [Bacteroides salyersiae]UYU43222.1 hypothetical protein KQP70_11510 [Bacteroides salyersiae]